MNAVGECVVLGVAIAGLVASVAMGAVCGAARELRAPDHAASARVSAADPKVSCDESQVEVVVGGKSVAAQSFGSSDGEHGYAVRAAAWTADSRFFVFDLVSSGGHQPMNAPIYVFARQTGALAPLALPQNLIPSSFKLTAGDRLSISAWDVTRQRKTRYLADLDAKP